MFLRGNFPTGCRVADQSAAHRGLRQVPLHLRLQRRCHRESRRQDELSRLYVRDCGQGKARYTKSKNAIRTDVPLNSTTSRVSRRSRSRSSIRSLTTPRRPTRSSNGFKYPTFNQRLRLGFQRRRTFSMRGPSRRLVVSKGNLKSSARSTTMSYTLSHCLLL